MQGVFFRNFSSLHLCETRLSLLTIKAASGLGLSGSMAWPGGAQGGNAPGNFANLMFLKHLQLLLSTLMLYFFCFKIHFFAQTFFIGWSLTHYSPVLLFYTPWKYQKIFRFSDVFRRYRKATPSCNELKPNLTTVFLLPLNRDKNLQKKTHTG